MTRRGDPAVIIGDLLMNQITTRYITENGACYEQYVITDPEAKTALTITPERGGMITSFTLDGEEFVWTRRPNFSECNRPRFGVPVLFPSCGNPDNGVHIFDGKAYPMETHGFADLCAWEVESVGPDGVTLALESTPLTKFLYPFDFTLLLNYNLEGNKALVSLTVINEGDTDMPFSFGSHCPKLSLSSGCLHIHFAEYVSRIAGRLHLLSTSVERAILH